MPTRFPRPPRRPKRLRALVAVCALAGACVAAVPSSASAYTEHFCQWQPMNSGDNCFAGSRHTLQWVDAYAPNTSRRVCAASFTGPWGTQNSNWHCDYAGARKYLWGVVGVGAIHNGDPSFFHGYATQDF